ncbi:MAG: glucose-1-phosphate adenylyltransferase [Puniceicoccales bacterium]|jgi:glucose-1-phosphate adenylyltransferase|nr:glucose-1-phosphate adenylyltransferase [Puniceicoccales bacterium]
MRSPNVKCIIMGGGRGTRLHPLTQTRCKPAVPLGGSYRLVDIPISNCINSGFNRIYVLTQYNTASLHRHIQQAYSFDPFSRGGVDILAAEQTIEQDAWYQGTADAVRQNMHHFAFGDDDLALILSGDQLFRMDLHEVVAGHKAAGADLTIATKAMPASEVSAFGVSRVNDEGEIVEFVEKPSDPAVIEKLVVGGDARRAIPDDSPCPYCLVSMGIYVFNAALLKEALRNPAMTDFGKEIIPSLLGRKKIRAHVFTGYWEDIGTVRSFWEANLALADPMPPFNFFDSVHPIYSHARFLPPAKINGGSIHHAIVSEGSIITNANLRRCVVGVRSVIRDGTRLNNVVMLGADAHEEPDDLTENFQLGRPHVGVGHDCVIQDAIIDKNARIGNAVRLSPHGVPEKWETASLYKRDGVIVVKKDAIVPDGTSVGRTE